MVVDLCAGGRSTAQSKHWRSPHIRHRAAGKYRNFTTIRKNVKDALPSLAHLGFMPSHFFLRRLHVRQPARDQPDGRLPLFNGICDAGRPCCAMWNDIVMANFTNTCSGLGSLPRLGARAHPDLRQGPSTLQLRPVPINASKAASGDVALSSLVSGSTYSTSLWP